MTISNEIQELVRRDVQVLGASYRFVAKKHGISRGAVKRIATGVPLRDRGRPSRDKPNAKSSKIRIVPQHSCPWCGYTINIKPCQICVALDAQMLPLGK